MLFLLFVFGAAFGSFINVVSLRYDPEQFLFGTLIRGRSACPHCKNKLTPRELIPIVSFLIQRGRCRHCKGRIRLQYPLVEILSGCVFVLVPLSFASHLSTIPMQYVLALNAIWILAFLSLLLISLIDIRLRVIPDELNIFIVLLGAARLGLQSAAGAPEQAGGSLQGTSFLGHYALLFETGLPLWGAHLFGAIVAMLFFLVIVLVTRGRGMGLGDVKLAAALGALFSWPDIGLIIILAFIVGALSGLCSIGLERASMKSLIPFGPFLALGAALTFFFGFRIIGVYFALFGLV